MEARAITIAILAMGGEGGGVLAGWIVDLAEQAGYQAQLTSVPGVAQRTGATIYYLEIFPETGGGQEPVLALMPVPGEVDIVIASELMEAGRAVARGFVTPQRTTLIASTHRVYSMTERTAAGDGRVNSSALLEAARAAARQFVCADFAAVASQAASVISAALFGALASSGALPFPQARFEDAIRAGGVGVEASLAAFHTAAAAGLAPPPAASSPARPPETSPALAEFHPAAHAILAAAIARLADYQDERYAAEYLLLLEPVRAADHGDFTLFRETARYLALWMSYEDAIRVADLKTRRERFQRVRLDARLAPGHLLRIHDYLYPRIGELADILPAPAGRWLLATAWARRIVECFTRKGRIVNTNGLPGFLKLRLVSSLRRWRRRSLRFAAEHQRISQWLELLPILAIEDYALACEVAECPRLLKGYGDTYAHGSAAFDAVMRALPELRGRPGAAARLREIREKLAAAPD
jgi:indolepyruvate ferredoxin oxidoreductase, beta subunit